MKKKYDVIGMTCSACSAHVDKAVRGLDGVDDVNVNLLQNSMTVEFNENKINENQIFEAVDKAGYKAQNIGEKQVSNVQEDENEHKKKNLILSFIFLIPLFYISMGHMMNWPLPSILLGHENMMMHPCSLFLLQFRFPVLQFPCGLHPSELCNFSSLFPPLALSKSGNGSKREHVSSQPTSVSSPWFMLVSHIDSSCVYANR